MRSESQRIRTQNSLSERDDEEGIRTQIGKSRPRLQI